MKKKQYIIPDSQVFVFSSHCMVIEGSQPVEITSSDNDDDDDEDPNASRRHRFSEFDDEEY